VIAFKQAFDGHVFVGAKGNQYRCSVEYAPFQKIPNSAEKKNARDGSIVKGAMTDL
jgi:regulator of nonsense transcripts 3